MSKESTPKPPIPDRAPKKGDTWVGLPFEKFDKTKSDLLDIDDTDVDTAFGTLTEGSVPDIDDDIEIDPKFEKLQRPPKPHKAHKTAEGMLTSKTEKEIAGVPLTEAEKRRRRILKSINEIQYESGIAPTDKRPATARDMLSGPIADMASEAAATERPMPGALTEPNHRLLDEGDYTEDEDEVPPPKNPKHRESSPTVIVDHSAFIPQTDGGTLVSTPQPHLDKPHKPTKAPESSSSPIAHAPSATQKTKWFKRGSGVLAILGTIVAAFGIHLSRDNKADTAPETTTSESDTDTVVASSESEVEHFDVRIHPADVQQAVEGTRATLEHVIDTGNTSATSVSHELQSSIAISIDPTSTQPDSQRLISRLVEHMQPTIATFVADLSRGLWGGVATGMNQITTDVRNGLSEYAVSPTNTLGSQTSSPTAEVRQTNTEISPIEIVLDTKTIGPSGSVWEALAQVGELPLRNANGEPYWHNPEEFRNWRAQELLTMDTPSSVHPGDRVEVYVDAEDALHARLVRVSGHAPSQRTSHPRQTSSTVSDTPRTAITRSTITPDSSQPYTQRTQRDGLSSPPQTSLPTTDEEIRIRDRADAYRIQREEEQAQIDQTRNQIATDNAQIAGELAARHIIDTTENKPNADITATWDDVMRGRSSGTMRTDRPTIPLMTTEYIDTHTADDVDDLDEGDLVEIPSVQVAGQTIAEGSVVDIVSTRGNTVRYRVTDITDQNGPLRLILESLDGRIHTFKDITTLERNPESFSVITR